MLTQKTQKMGFFLVFFKFPNWGWVFLDFFGIGFFWFFFWFFLDFLGFLGFLKIPFMIFHWIIRFPIGVGFFTSLATLFLDPCLF